MAVKTIIPDRYTSSECKTKDINVYEIHKDYAKLIILDRLTKKTLKTVLFEKSDYQKVSQLHWQSKEHSCVPRSTIGVKNITVTFGKYITGSDFKVYGKVKGKAEWDFRKEKYTKTGNTFSVLDEKTVQMELYRKNGTILHVLFDKEDYSLISEHRWFVSGKEYKKDAYNISSRINNICKTLHIFILEAHKQFQYAKSFDLRCKNNVLDMRKSTLYKSFAVNTYSDIDSKTKELTVKYAKGEVKIIFDSRDHKRISTINWGHSVHSTKEKIYNYKYGQLKHFILGADKNRQIREIKDKKGRFDFRRKTLHLCLLKNLPVKIGHTEDKNETATENKLSISDRKFKNVYERTDEYLKLLIIDRQTEKTVQSIYFEKDDYVKLIKHNWRISESYFSAYTIIDNKRISVGKYIYRKDIHILGKMKGKTVLDFRNNFHGNIKNIYSIIDDHTMKLNIYTGNIGIYSVIFDKADYPFIGKYIWRITKLKSGEYRVISTNRKKMVYFHIYVIKSLSEDINCSRLKDVNHKENLFDYRKSVLYEKQGLNIYTSIDSDTTELCINSADGKIKMILDKEDCPKVSKMVWGYNKLNRKGFVYNEKYGQLKKFILGLPKRYSKHINEIKDKHGRLDFRKETLNKCHGREKKTGLTKIRHKNYTVVMPDRYEYSKKNTKYVNVFEIRPDHVRLLIIERSSKKTLQTIYLEKSDYENVLKHHWKAGSANGSAYTVIYKKTVNIGKFISGQDYVYGKIPGEAAWDFRKGKYHKSENSYCELDSSTMKLEIPYKDGTMFSVIFDKEDYSLLQKYSWYISKIGNGDYIVTATDSKKTTYLHLYLLKSSPADVHCGSVKDIVCKNNRFDFRKSVLYKKPGVNIYSDINHRTKQLNINSPMGEIRVIFDKTDYEKVSKIIWGYRKSEKKYVIFNDKHGSLKKLILGFSKKQFKVINEKKDAHGRFDFRKSVLKEQSLFNSYSDIGTDSKELTINSVHGRVKVIFDREDYKRVSKEKWRYSKSKSSYTIVSKNDLPLKKFILGLEKERTVIISVKRDKCGRFDFRKKTLAECVNKPENRKKT